MFGSIALSWESMKVAVASDHAGFPLKAQVIEELHKLGHQALDLGTDSTDPVDDDVNVMCLGARVVGAGLSVRRLGKIAGFEEKFGRSD